MSWRLPPITKPRLFERKCLQSIVTDRLFSHLWKSAARKRTAKCIERSHTPRWWCLQYLNWIDNKSNWHPWCFSFRLSSPPASVYASVEGKWFSARFDSPEREIAIFVFSSATMGQKGGRSGSTSIMTRRWKEFVDCCEEENIREGWKSTRF